MYVGYFVVISPCSLIVYKIIFEQYTFVSSEPSFSENLMVTPKVCGNFTFYDTNFKLLLIVCIYFGSHFYVNFKFLSRQYIPIYSNTRYSVKLLVMVYVFKIIYLNYHRRWTNITEKLSRKHIFTVIGSFNKRSVRKRCSLRRLSWIICLD